MGISASEIAFANSLNNMGDIQRQEKRISELELRISLVVKLLRDIGINIPVELEDN